jgi:hypothetical protein
MVIKTLDINREIETIIYDFLLNFQRKSQKNKSMKRKRTDDDDLDEFDEVD